MILEVIASSIFDAITAHAAGADRLEFAVDLAAGGLTPSLGLLEAVRAAVPIPVFVMLRPRPGGFCYDRDEFAVLQRDLGIAKAAGAHGFVAGVLGADHRLDRDRMRALVDLAAPLPLTCHRAFDLVPDQTVALEELIGLGVTRVLSSGAAPDAFAGRLRLAALVQQAAGRIVVMAGAGIEAGNVRELVAVTGVREVHASCAIAVEDDAGFGQARRVDAAKVRALRSSFSTAYFSTRMDS